MSVPVISKAAVPVCLSQRMTGAADFIGRGRSRLDLRLDIRIEDIDFFLVDPEHKGSASGCIDCPELGGKIEADQGTFQCLVDAGGNNRTVRYVLYFKDQSGRALTLAAETTVNHRRLRKAWQELRTLSITIFEGDKKVAAGSVKIDPINFVAQIARVRAESPLLIEKKRAAVKFGQFFFGALWETYAPRVGGVRSDDSERLVPLFTLEGVRDAEITTHYFSTADHLGLSLLRFHRTPSNDVVVLFHGLTK